MTNSENGAACATWSEALLDEAAGRPAPDDFAAHARACDACQRERERLGGLFSDLALAVEAPAAVEEALMRRVRRDLGDRALDLSWITSMLIGATLAAVASLLAAARGGAGESTTWTIALSSVAWTAAFSVVVHTLRHAQRGPWSTLPLAVAVGAILVVPAPSAGAVCAACEIVGMGLAAARVLFIVTGVFVGLGLTTLVNRLLGQRWRRTQRTAIAAGVVLATVGPALYMACAPFSVGSLVGLLGGLAAGIGLSAVRGLWRLTPTRGRS